MVEHKDAHMCTWYHRSLGLGSMTIFVVISPDLKPYVLDTRVNRGAGLSTDLYLVVSWIRWRGKLWTTPGKPEWIVRLCWERPAETVWNYFNSTLYETSMEVLEAAK